MIRAFAVFATSIGWCSIAWGPHGIARVRLPEGEYEFVCDIHPNMVGTLAVTDANPADP